MESHYFEASTALTGVVGQLAAEGVPFRFVTRDREPRRFPRGGSAEALIELTHSDAEKYRRLLDSHSVGAE